MLFCDTSTLAKYYVPEKETEAVIRRLDAADRVVLSELAKTELMAVFHRRLREGNWNQDEFAAAIRQFQHDDAGLLWDWMPIEATITQQAAQAFATLPQRVFLRPADSLHLITALRHGFDTIYTHDVHQSNGAEALGLTSVQIE